MPSCTPRRPSRRAAATAAFMLACTTLCALPAPAATAASDPLPAATADDTPDGDAEEKPSGAQLQPVTVTAEGRQAPARNAPGTVAAFTRDDLTRLGVENSLDLPRFVPGVVYNDFVGFSVVYMRGVGSDQFLPSGDLSIETYIDNIYTPFGHALAQEFFNIEDIVVRKGPQGTEYGHNSVGGSINLITQAPSRELRVSASSRFGSFGTRKLKGAISGGLGERIRIGLAAFDTRHDSYYHRPAGSPRPGFRDETARGGQVRLSVDLAKTLRLDLAAIHMKQDGAGTALVSAFNTKPLFALLVPETGETYVSDPDVPPRLKARNNLFYGHLRWMPQAFNARLSLSHQDVTTFTQFDFEGSPAPLVTFRPRDMGARITTAELRFNSRDGGFLADFLEWDFGFYFLDNRDAGFRDVQFTVAESLTDPLLAPSLRAVDAALANLGLPLNLPDGIKLFLDGLVNTRSEAVYGQARWALTDDLGLTFGARQTWDHRQLTRSKVALLGANGTAGLTLLRWTPGQRADRNFSPKVTLDYRVFDHYLLYASWKRGFKSGTFNVLNVLKQPTQVEPTTVTNYEVGIKGEAFDRNLRFSAAAFQNRIHNRQTLILSLQSSGAVTLENAPEAVIKGLEFEANWWPLPRLVPGLMLTTALSTIDGRYTRYPQGTGFEQSTGLFQNNLDFTGHRTERAPKFAATLGFEYLRQVPGGFFDLSSSVLFNSGYFFDAQNVARQRAYKTVQARIGYTHIRTGLSIAVFGTNLTNDRIWLNQFQTDFNTVGTLGAPRLWGVALGWEFG
ncbi:MAG: hypothetical protein EPN72_13180 [Nevskiaceae bacterium]|nr:MAG: hypothetical protein EPN63_02695 [Nevskiaceae bacterium]TBR71652.1 MAG: hypothetical protein EPN72_13180 [Nevskiaceae bacterium]